MVFNQIFFYLNRRHFGIQNYKGKNMVKDILTFANSIFMRGSFIYICHICCNIYVTTSVTEISLGKSEGRVRLFLVTRCLRQRNISMKVQRLCCTQDGRLTLLHMASRDKQHKPTRPEPEQSCVVSHYHYLGTTMSTSSFPPANWSAHMVHC